MLQWKVCFFYIWYKIYRINFVQNKQYSTAFAFGAYTNDREYWRKILEASAMYKSFSAAFYVTACIINQEGST